MTVEELRQKALNTFDAWACNIVDGWPDTVFDKALKSKKDPLKVLMEYALSHNEAENPTEATGVATGASEASRTARSITRYRKPREGLSVATEDISILLTPKQLEFMERLSELQDWDNNGTSGWYNASEYAQELSDTMSPMSVGAILTTLREKHLLRTEKHRIGAIKCCIFSLTDLGIQVYNKLSGEVK